MDRARATERRGRRESESEKKSDKERLEEEAVRRDLETRTRAHTPDSEWRSEKGECKSALFMCRM